MNKDSDKNENRRDGDNSRSFGRRDDGRTSKPAGSRGSDSDRPRFSRNDGPRNDGPRNDGPRNDRPRNDGPRNNDRPSFGRSANGPRNDRDGGAKPRFERSDDRPRFGRSDSNASDRPRSNDRNRDERPGGSPFGARGRSDSDRSRPDRPAGPSRPSFGRDRTDSDRSRTNDSSRPRFERNDRSEGPARPRSTDSDQRRARPENDRNTDKPRFDRNEGGAKPRNDGPRFERRDDSDRPRNNDTPRPRTFNRDDKTDRRPADARPRFPRDDNRADKPAGRGTASPDRFKRVGGFSREADERNRENWSAPEKEDSPGAGSGSKNTRFTPEQRKDSGDRRTGFFVKAPNYELEQKRIQRIPGFKAGGRAADAGARPRTERSAPKGRPDLRKNTSEPEQPSARTPTGEPGTTRLNRYIANSGVCSRREADELIARGDISVNGKVVTEMGFRVKEGDMVKYGTKALTPERFVYVLLNKPKDYLTTTEDPEERKTVMELVADAGNFRMYPVGRLDRKTTGLLLVTNDGELADKLTHPSNNVRKIYQVELDKPITEEHFDAIKKGLDLEDGPIKPDALSIVTPDAYVVGIEIHSGRNRIVRRIFESLGYDVTKLDRTTYAGLTKKELPRGKWRFLDPKEVVKLKYLS
ncbi:pseudouridine synthase [Spirosoma utsteinense]|uniref:Pseudouridine synthase n=1 Tax=Spirosoma utsteinense TaxID=2585773 RepID=A0ABR6W9B7_9BACT|nr:pseudouridine synthase [Spirosoma utsteinense]MBC3788523.1 23S rRNA pseudouridine2605 synthase [Spirosoma utsteinense]MBC3793163.1 23S rRNA pseudouridine2605 synthase [Spirosoma utsteinense]